MAWKQIFYGGVAGLFALSAASCERLSPQSSGGDEGDEKTAEEVAESIMKAHGGKDSWASLKTMLVAREHHYTGQEQPMLFNIHAEYRTERIYQKWERPAGELAWDGERGWSVNWPLADALPPRFVAGIGFYLINLPWFVNTGDATLVSLERRSDLSPVDDRDYIVLTVDYDGTPRRRPKGQGRGDTLDLYIDPETRRLAGVQMHWRYASQLAPRGADTPARTEIYQGYVIENYIEHEGIFLPNEYTIFDSNGEVQAQGRYYDYVFDVPLDEEKFAPETIENVKFDNSSSYRIPVQ